MGTPNCSLCVGKRSMRVYCAVQGKERDFEVREFECPVCLAADGKREETEKIIDEVRKIGADGLLSKIYTGLDNIIL